MFEPPRDEFFAIGDTNQMSAPKDRVQVDDVVVQLSSSIPVWLHPPHLGVWAWFVANGGIPGYQSARISHSAVLNKEKCINSCHQATAEAPDGGIRLHINTVVMGWPFPP